MWRWMNYSSYIVVDAPRGLTTRVFQLNFQPAACNSTEAFV